MSVLLAIEASPRGVNSVSKRLSASFIAHWQSAHPGGQIIRRDLIEASPPFLDQAWIGGAVTRPEQRSPEMQEAMRISDELIGEILTADHILLATPMINFAIPAVLKAYIDQIVRIGATCTPQYEGLLRGKAATVILASGADYSPGSKWESADAASPYLKQILGFIGIADVTVIRAGATLAIDRGETNFDDYALQFEGKISEAARI
ncbi:MAG: FMN-dependent NADH-azoreductase [Methylovirgula sp.]